MRESCGEPIFKLIGAIGVDSEMGLSWALLWLRGPFFGVLRELSEKREVTWSGVGALEDGRLERVLSSVKAAFRRWINQSTKIMSHDAAHTG